MAYEDTSGLPNAFDRAADDPLRSRVVFPEGVYLQGADLNEAQTILANRTHRIGDLTAKNGDVVSGASISINSSTAACSLAAGTLYIEGDVRPVAAATISAFPLVGSLTVGVKLVRTLVTPDDDPTLVGLAPGTDAEGEPGASRVRDVITWALANDSQPGSYYPVYQVVNGVVIDQKTPPSLSGIIQQIANYDFDALGSYAISAGNMVAAISRVPGTQVFQISAGTANIQGFKRIRNAALLHTQAEEPDLETETAEPILMTGPDGGTSTLVVARPPINDVISVVIVKRVTQTVTRGSTPGGLDALQFSSVTQVLSVTQGGTTYHATTDYVLSNGSISWAPSGAEPAAASTYLVTYLYNASATPHTITDTSLQVDGGVNGQSAQVTYRSKLPRIDLLCLDVTGNSVYIKGVSARKNALPPVAPSSLLKLAELSQTWMDVPTITNNGPRNYTFEDQQRYFGRLIDVLDQFDRTRLKSSVVGLDPVSQNGIFTDTFVDDTFRDSGEAQTAAVNQGVLQLAIDRTLLSIVGTDLQTLPWTEVISVEQDQATSSMRINPYDNFTPMPVDVQLVPNVDFWTDTQTVWTSDVTREFSAAPDTPPGVTVINEVTEVRQALSPLLRQINVTVSVSGFGVGENLSHAYFDNIDVTPSGAHTADASGLMSFSFQIPANVPAGSHTVRVRGAAGAFGEATYYGQGTIVVDVMRHVNLVTRSAPPPVQVTNVTVQQTIVNTITQPVVFNPWAGTGDIHAGDDPLAQSFSVPTPRMIVGFDIMFTAIGNRANGVRVQLSPLANGLPSNDVLAEAFINMTNVQTGVWTQARFKCPVYVSNLQQYCIVILTADADHALAISRLGDVVNLGGGAQARVASQPYTVGVLFASANRISWTPIQDADLTFRVVTASFTATSRSVNLFQGQISNISDIIVRGPVEMPTQDAIFRYEMVRASGQVIALAPGQTYEFSEYVTENVTIRAVLGGSEAISPVLYPGTTIVGGAIRTSGSYVTRLFPMGVNKTVRAVLSELVPAGSSVEVDVDAGDDNWQQLSSSTSTSLGGNWSDVTYSKSSYTAANGRIRVALNGGPGERVSVAQLRAYTI